MRRMRIMGILVVSVVVLAHTSSIAEAQRRGRRSNVTRRAHTRGFGFYAPAYWGLGYGAAFSPFFSPWYGYGLGFAPYGGFVGTRSARASSLRVMVEPQETEVFVDGHYAGLVDDYDGYFQRLRLAPGEHEITLYLDGHKSVRQSLYLSSGVTYKIRAEMEPLAPGESPEPRPEPAEAPSHAVSVAAASSSTSSSARAPAIRSQGSRFGELALSVQPSGTVVLIDGETWPAFEGWQHLRIHLPAGPHTVELRKQGYTSFSTDIELEAGSSAELNVRLDPR